MKHRNLVSFASITVPVVLGYAIGTLLLLLILANLRDGIAASYDVKNFADLVLWHRYRFEGFGVPYADTEHHSIVTSILVIIVIVISASTVSKAASFAYIHLFAVSLRQWIPLRHYRRWRNALLFSRVPRRRWWFVRTAITSILLVGASFLADTLLLFVRERLWMRNPTQTSYLSLVPEPIVGWLTGSDVLTFFACLSGFWFLGSYRSIRSRVRRSRYLGARRCRSCGYPLADVVQKTRGKAAGASCPECGTAV